MSYMRNSLTTDYLHYLEKKESKVIFSLKNKTFLHGELTSFLRIFKGLILGFGLGNLLILKARSPSLLYCLILLFLFFTLSVLLINYERRTYKRKNLKNSVKRALYIFLICLIFSSLVFLYSN